MTMDEAQPQASLAATDNSLGSSSGLPLADNEKRILDLYDRLQQLQLEVALINAQNNYQPRIYLTCSAAGPLSLSVNTMPRPSTPK